MKLLLRSSLFALLVLGGYAGVSATISGSTNYGLPGACSPSNPVCGTSTSGGVR